MVDSRILQHAKLDPIPNTAADFRNWKNTLILLLGRLDISGSDYLKSWVAHAFKVNMNLCHAWIVGWLLNSLRGWKGFLTCNSRCRVTLSIVHVMGQLHAIVQCFTCLSSLWLGSRPWVADYFSVHFSSRIAWLPNFGLTRFFCSGHAWRFPTAFLMISGRINECLVSSCFISWGLSGALKEWLMRSNVQQMTRHSVTLISCGLDCRNSWLKKGRMPMQGLLNNPSKAQRDQQTSHKQKPRPYRPKLLQLLQPMQVQPQLLRRKLCQRKPLLSHLRKENQKDRKTIECGRKGQDAMYLPSDAIWLCAWCHRCWGIRNMTWCVYVTVSSTVIDCYLHLCVPHLTCQAFMYLSFMWTSSEDMQHTSSFWTEAA